jgi:hypothetical protein
MQYCSLILTLALAGCATAPTPTVHWIRADGAVSTPQQFEIDQTVCKGEAQKANASGTVIPIGGMYGAAAAVNRNNAINDVFSGCMAQRGYLLRSDTP